MNKTEIYSPEQFNELMQGKRPATDENKQKRASIQHEAQIQESFFNWVRYQYPELTVFAIPNGGTRNRFEAYNMKKQGVTKGVPDVFVSYPAGKYHGMYIEFKYGNNKPSREQQVFMDNALRNGYYCCVCYSVDEAMENVTKYIDGLIQDNEKELQEIKGAICRMMDTDWDTFTSPLRERRFADIRIIVSRYMSETLGMKPGDIGRFLNRDRTTIIHHLNLYDDYMKHIPEFKEKCRKFMEGL